MLSPQQIQTIRACSKDEPSFEHILSIVADQHSQDEAGQIEKTLQRRDAILEAVGFAAEQFLRISQIDQSIQAVLERLGNATEVSRVYIFVNRNDDEGALVCDQRYEWAAPGVEPQIDNPELKGVPYEAAGLNRWVEQLDLGHPLHGLVKNFPQAEREVLEPQEILSIAVVPIFVGQQWWGFIGFDDCTHERAWTLPEIDTLKAAAGLLGAAIQRDRVQETLRQNEKLLQSIIDNYPAVIFAKDLQGHFILVNQQFATFHRRAKQDLLGKTDYDIHPPNFAADHRQNDQHVLAAGTPIAYEEILPTDQGERIYLAIKFPLYDTNSTPYAICGIATDITEQKRAEESLRASEKRYRGLIESQIDLIVRVDPDGRFTFVNDVYCRTFGKDREELLGHTFTPLVHEDDIQPTLEAMKGLEVPPYRIYVEQRALTAHGWRWLAWEDYAIKDEAGQTVEVQAIGRDITDRKQAEEALRRSEAHYRAIVEDQTELICRFLPDGMLTFVNDAMCRYYRVQRDEVVGTRFRPGIPSNDMQNLERFFATITPDHPVSMIEHRVLMPDGEERWQQWTYRLITDERNHPAEYQVVGRDITERVRAQETLVRISAAVESTSDAISIGDMSGTALYHNQAFRDLYGYDSDALNALGGPTAIFVNPDIAHEVLATAMDGRSWSGEVEFRTANGRTVPTLLRADCIKDEAGKRQGLIAVCTDITVQKQVEQELIAARESALETSRLKSEFLANMSHEIRTPLNAIIGMTGLLLELELDEEAQEFVETVRTSSDTLLMLINDILDFSKIEAGKLDLEHQPFEIRACIEDSLDLVASQAADKGLELAYTINEDTPPMLVGDVTRLRQVLVNLLSNAVKFTEQGEIVVRVHTERKTDLAEPESDTKHNSEPVREARKESETTRPSLCTLRLSVSDTGIGIPSSRMNRLFQSFSQIDSSVTRKYGGSGLGLAISKALVEAMGGSIHVESAEGKGSTFHFTIVVREVPGLPRDFLHNEQPHLSGRRALIVDDNQANRFILSRQLHSWGMYVRATPSGHEALDWIRWGESFDIAILDMQMPEMDGLTLAQEIRAHRSEQSLPLMMLTSVGGLRSIVPDDDVTFAAFLSKPVKPSHLHNILLTIFAGQGEHTKDLSFVPSLSEAQDTPLPLRILVAEDHTVNQRVALRLLKRLGYRADLAANGLEVIEALERQPYDVVLMDVQMPEMDGEETTRRIRAEVPAERQPRIIAVTAHALKGSRERYLAAGMDDYISKPVRLQELATALRKCTPLNDSEKYPTRARTDPLVPEEHTPALDAEVLRDLTEEVEQEDLDEVRDILLLFIESTPDLMRQLHEAVATQDPAQLRSVAHTIKGSAQIGAKTLSSIAAELQDLGDQGTVEGAPTLIARLETEYERVQDELTAFVDELDEATGGATP